MIGELSILIAEDDPDDLELIAEACQNIAPKIRVMSVKNGQEVFVRQLDYVSRHFLIRTFCNVFILEAVLMSAQHFKYVVGAQAVNFSRNKGSHIRFLLAFVRINMPDVNTG